MPQRGAVGHDARMAGQAKRLRSATGLPGSRATAAPDRRLPRGRHDLSREFVARSQRDRLIDAMARTVAAKGYQGACVTDVCTAAGVSTKAFYTHFEDKEECFLATFDRGVWLVSRTMLVSHGRPGPWPVRMREGLELLLRILADEPAFATLAVVEALAAGPRALQRHHDLLASFTVFFHDAPRRASWPAVPVEAVRAVIAGIYGLIHGYVSTGRADQLPGLLPDLTYFALAPFIGPRAAATAAGLTGSALEVDLPTMPSTASTTAT
jgi:AcrR family transcriptional regulator